MKSNPKKTQLLLLGRKGRAQELDGTYVILNGEQLSRRYAIICTTTEIGCTVLIHNYGMFIVFRLCC